MICPLCYRSLELAKDIERNDYMKLYWDCEFCGLRIKVWRPCSMKEPPILRTIVRERLRRWEPERS